MLSYGKNCWCIIKCFLNDNKYVYIGTDGTVSGAHTSDIKRLEDYVSPLYITFWKGYIYFTQNYIF